MSERTVSLNELLEAEVEKVTQATAFPFSQKAFFFLVHRVCFTEPHALRGDFGTRKEATHCYSAKQGGSLQFLHV